MKRLLNQTETRRLLAIEILYEQNDWITLSTLAKKLDCSLRVLKKDMAYFKKNCEEFTIESSNYGVRLVPHKNAGMKILYQYTLRKSTAYNLLENIFLKKEMTVKEITQLLSLGSSTVYRLIDQINSFYEDLGFKIATNPCRIVGNEKEIRYFFYNYFHAKYSNLYWPFENIDQDGLDHFLQFFIEYTETMSDFAYYNIFKTVSVVNLIRYKHCRNLRANFIFNTSYMNKKRS